MSKYARMLCVQTSAVYPHEQYVTCVAGTLESVTIDGRWSYNTIWQRVNEAIDKRVKSGILKQNVGYAVYNGRNLVSLHINSEFSKLPRRWID